MNSNTTISDTVMRRVRRVHALQSVVSVTTLSALVFVLALWGIGREVWVAKVIANMPSLFDVPALARFMTSAFLHTDFIVQSATVIALAALLWLARELARSLISTVRFA
ncbi:MAG: hypothetical protein AB199_00060 [Parcubacteria bacterium C7867-004]|nr:MAG: hypothetical protein AB199_00060 [Parcubacteria bacterium C7867-004]